MAGRFEVFEWYRWSGGVEVQRRQPAYTRPADSQPAHGAYLVAVDPAASADPYAPLDDEPALYRRFGRLGSRDVRKRRSRTSTAEIVEFASSYGFLSAIDVSPGVWLEPREGTAAWEWGEPLAAWRAEAQRMRRAVALWEWARRGDVGELERFITWSGLDPSVVLQCPPDLARQFGQGVAFPISTPKCWPHRRDRYAEHDVIQPAFDYVQHLVNDTLRERCTVLLLREGQAAKQRRVPDTSLSIVPRDLLGAMWLQLARAIDGDKQYRNCELCGLPFEIHAKPRGNPRRFCSARCKVKAHRQQRKST